MGIAIGIDLGTSRCRVAVVDKDTPRVVSSRAGGPSTPTMVSFSDAGMNLGAAAEAQAASNPERTIFSFLRFLGRKYMSAEVDWLRACLPFPVVAADNGDVHIHVDGRDFSPQELTSYVLESLIKDVEKRVGRNVDQAVVAVPSCFDDLQRRAVLEACRLARLEVTGLLNATTAAAISFSAAEPDIHRIAVADVGAGTFDVAICKLERDVIETVAIAGDPMLGGDDLDRRLVLQFIDAFAEKRRVDLTDQPDALLRFITQARETRHELTERTKTKRIRLPAITTLNGVEQEFEHPSVTRRQLVTLIAEELASVKDPCCWALEDAHLGTDDLQRVIVVGGVTRMPAIKSAFKYLYRSVPDRPANADYMVALGAARYAAALAGYHRRLEVREVTPCSTGIKIRGNRLLPVIARNSPIPFRHVRHFQAAGGGQNQAVFELFQGENELATENT